ncbi:MAG: N-acetyltransferase [Chloroflexi bacterium]|nr:N-acetyltransferase [Chloroflexota bacterium]
MPPVIRLAEGGDAAPVQAIYAPVVRDTAISFELEIPDVPEMRRRIVNALEGLPWLVCESDERILGYAYAGPHRARAAYQWSVEVSVYVQADARQMGVGRALYRSLFDLLTLQGFRNAFAGITLPNPASVALHESLGFQPIGVYRDVGHKLGRWHDVGWWQLPLGEDDGPPGPPVELPSAAGSPAWKAAMESGLGLLRL